MQEISTYSFGSIHCTEALCDNALYKLTVTLDITFNSCKTQCIAALLKVIHS